MPKKLSDMRVGDIHQTKNGLIEILEIKNFGNIRISFLEYPYETIVRAGSIRDGQIKNYMKPSVCNIGFLGVGKYPSKINNKATTTYQCWKAMLNRVYKPDSEQLARQYKDTEVNAHWHNFQNFAEWYHEQIDRFGPVDHTWQLDKDLLVPGNRIYGPDTCCVIPHSINSLLLDRGALRGDDLPLGVTTSGTSFQARIHSHGLRKSIGIYKTVSEAQMAYWEAKMKAIRETTLLYWQYLPEPLMLRLLGFGWEDAVAYYRDDARIWVD